MTGMVTLTLSARQQAWSTMDGVASRPPKGGVQAPAEWKGSPARTRLPDCRELLPPRTTSNPTPSVWLHEPACSCKPGAFNGQQQQEDEALAKRILVASETYRTRNKQAALAATKPKKTRRRYSGVISVSWLFPSAPTRLPAQIEELCTACSSLDIDKVTRLLENKTPINTPTRNGATPLMAAVRAPDAFHRPRSHLALITFLLDCGADPNAMTTTAAHTYPTSILASACTLDLPDIVRLLLCRGAAVDTPLTSSGLTALHMASLAGHAACVDILTSHGNANIDATFDIPRATHLGPAVLRRSSARASAPTRDVTALHLACDNAACAASLLAKGADSSARDSNGRTPLHWAVYAGNPGVVARLLGAGADADAVDRDGATPLAMLVEMIERDAAGDAGPEVMGLLLGHCADANRRGPGGGGMSLRHRVLMVERWRRAYGPVLERF